MSCEMCNSVDIVKEGDYYVCQSCGTKYTVEAARNLMIEGTVEVKGTVKIDNTDFVKKTIENARRAFSKEDWSDVEKYYNIVEQNVSNNMEAVFFSAYGKAMLSLSDSDYSKREQKFNVLKNSISMICNYYDVTKEEKHIVLNSITSAISKMYTIRFVYNKGKHSGLGSYAWQMYLFNSTKSAFLAELKRIYERHNDEYDYLKSLRNSLMPKKKSGACYIATCVYGSYDCPQVWTLRRYRDNILSKNFFGRVFIRIYYSVSPTIVKYFGKTDFFQRFWRSRLDILIKKLNNKGITNTPYSD